MFAATTWPLLALALINCVKEDISGKKRGATKSAAARCSALLSSARRTSSYQVGSDSKGFSYLISLLLSSVLYYAVLYCD